MPPFWQISDAPHIHSPCKDFSLHFYKPWNLTYWILFIKRHFIPTQICTAETLQATAIRIGGKHYWKNYKMHSFNKAVKQGNGISRNKNLSGMVQCIHHPTSLRPTLILLSHIYHVFPFRLPDQKLVYIFYHYHACYPPN